HTLSLHDALPISANTDKPLHCYQFAKMYPLSIKHLPTEFGCLPNCIDKAKLEAFVSFLHAYFLCRQKFSFFYQRTFWLSLPYKWYQKAWTIFPTQHCEIL